MFLRDSWVNSARISSWVWSHRCKRHITSNDLENPIVLSQRMTVCSKSKYHSRVFQEEGIKFRGMERCRKPVRQCPEQSKKWSRPAQLREFPLHRFKKLGDKPASEYLVKKSRLYLDPWIVETWSYLSGSYRRRMSWNEERHPELLDTYSCWKPAQQF